jgi:hypothetical protein
MAKRFHPPANKAKQYAHFVMQKLRVEKHFPSFCCRLNSGVLECNGDIRPTDESTSYAIRIRYKLWSVPEVHVVRPTITPNSKIHMYADGRLCLYHPPTQPWKGSDNLHQTIIPWTAEWLVYYELFLSEGKWLGPEIPHGSLAV